MGMLDRYKKKGGFAQLLQLIETSPKSKQEQFLQLIASESPVWEEAIRLRVLTIEKIYSWPSDVLFEAFSRIQPLQLATALHGMPEVEIERLLSGFPAITKRKITDMIAEANPTPPEKSTCMAKIIVEVRGFVSQGIIKAEKVDADLIVADDIEEKLNSSSSGISISELSNLKNEINTKSTPAPNGDVAAPNQEIEFLKRKMNQLISEVNALKTENSHLKDKLSQIRKIA